VYNPTEDNNAVIPYTTEVTMKYPKPGYNNPLVSVHVFDLGRFLTDDSVINAGFPAENVTMTLDWDGRHPVENSIISEVTWADDEQLLVKEVNRNADDGSVVFFDFKGTSDSRSKGRVVRKLGRDGEQGDEGWIDSVSIFFQADTCFHVCLRNKTYIRSLRALLQQGQRHIWMLSQMQMGITISHYSVRQTPVLLGSLHLGIGKSPVGLKALT